MKGVKCAWDTARKSPPTDMRWRKRTGRRPKNDRESPNGFAVSLHLSFPCSRRLYQNRPRTDSHFDALSTPSWRIRSSFTGVLLTTFIGHSARRWEFLG